MTKLRLATTWLDGCSGCHMSFLDMDELLVDLAGQIEVVYGPLVDRKDVPEEIDIALVEGAVSSEHDLELVRKLRANSRILVSLGDCAVTSNVPAMRNHFPVKQVLECGYQQNADRNQSIPSDVIPALLPQTRPIHEYIPVDVFIPGCPPCAKAIHFALAALLKGETPDVHELTRFGA
ncbi:MAG: NADP oxidoreductase [bacterium]|nr:NADP oxidoreductase [bacterium]